MQYLQKFPFNFTHLVRLMLLPLVPLRCWLQLAVSDSVDLSPSAAYQNFPKSPLVSLHLGASNDEA